MMKQSLVATFIKHLSEFVSLKNLLNVSDVKVMQHVKPFGFTKLALAVFKIQ